MAKAKETQTERAAPELPSAFSLFKPSWEAMMVNISTFLALVLLPAAYFLVISLVFGSFSGNADTGEVSFAGLPLMLVGVVFALFVGPALPYVQLKSIRGEQVSLGESLRVGMSYFWRFYGVTLLAALYIIGGFLLLIVPGFFMIRRYVLSPFYLYDQQVGVMEALRRSAADSKQFAGALWGLIGVMVLIGLPSIIPLLGLISTVLQIVYYCAPAIRYRQIQGALGNKAAAK